MELQGRSSKRALRNMDISFLKVMRDGKVTEISSENLVLGDIVLMEAGDLIAADGRLLECNQLACDGSSLARDSFHIMKNTDVLNGQVTLGDSFSMAFKGT